MKRRRSLLFGLGVLVSLSMSVPTYAASVDAMSKTAQMNEVGQDGDETDGEEQSYQILKDTDEEKWQITDKDGNAVTKEGFYVIGDACYYADDNGYILTGFVEVTAEDGEDKVKVFTADGTEAYLPVGTYYGSKEGEVPGKILKDTWAPEKLNDAWLYLDEDGCAYDELPQEYTKWQQFQGTWYYLTAEGKVDASATGWSQLEENRWIYGENGVGSFKSGWQNVKANTWLYLDANGKNTGKTGMQTIGTKTYYLDVSGVAQNGKFTVNGEQYLFNVEKGTAVKNGWNRINGKWYWYENWTTRSGWLNLAGQWYYLNSDGSRAAEWACVNGTWYYMDPSTGVMRTGWVLTPSGWYYMNSSGAMLTGWYRVNGTWYYSNSSGTMQTGWLKLGNTWYFLEDSGAMRTGWLSRPSGWYYLTSSGAMATGWYRVNGTWYYSNSSGTMQTGWVKVGNTWYYLTSSGAMKTGWLKDGANWYYLTSSGAMATGWNRIGGYKYYFAGGGAMMQDLDSVIGRQSSYYITVNRARCQVMVYARSETGRYDIPVKTFACSVGMPSTPTPTGTYRTLQKYRWHTLMGPSYGQYCTRIVGGILFHSVAGSNMTSYNLSAGEYNRLGQPASHGCVRLCVRDAKWIYDRCGLGTTVTINDSAAAPFDKPASIKIPASQNWDPTDPNV